MGRHGRTTDERAQAGTGGLYLPGFEHDACGTGWIADRWNRPSRRIVDMALTALARLEHRGATGADPDTGDGAGVLFSIPDPFFRRLALEAGVDLPPPGGYLVATLFLPLPEEEAARGLDVFGEAAREAGAPPALVRRVPCDRYACGETARRHMPSIWQAILVPTNGPDTRPADDPATAYGLRRTLEKALDREFDGDAAIHSLSARTVTYKGMLRACQVADFFRDFADPDFVSAIALFHSRFSTNTFPSWDRAQPGRLIAHNGEINTLRCVENAMRGRERDLSLAVPGAAALEKESLVPVLDPDGSDSQKFDNCVELLVAAGRSLPRAVAMMVPGPWSADPSLPETHRDFFEYSACVMPPWDGPAALCFTDGLLVGAALDRNGLRPARFSVTRDGLVILASEAGVADLPPSEVIRKGKLGPGGWLVLDPSTGEILQDGEVLDRYLLPACSGWLAAHRTILPRSGDDALDDGIDAPAADRADALQAAYGYTFEDQQDFLIPMARTGEDPVGSMGTDIPLAFLSDKPQPLFNYVKQMFAQVTNPPIDAIRERIVVGTEVFLGAAHDLLRDDALHCRKVRIPSPVLDGGQFESLRSGAGGFLSRTLPIVFPAGTGGGGLEEALRVLVERAVGAIRDGVAVLVLSDRNVDAARIPIPSLLAVSALHQALVARSLRSRVSLVLDSFEPREVHHIACLTGFGCDAVFPRGALVAVRSLCRSGRIPGSQGKALANLVHAMEYGLVKVMSRMGISTVQGYMGAQVFEILGLGRETCDRFFAGTPSRIGGIGLAEIAEDAEAMHARGFGPASGTKGSEGPGEPVRVLPSGGRLRVRADGETHLYDPQTIHLLQEAVRTGNYDLYRRYADLLDGDRRNTLRSLLAFREGRPVPLEEVEPESAIFRRFKTGAMSFGSISREAHECLAVAMNRLGGKSNSGEGGESPDRLGTSRSSAIKQVASGRFGVTCDYLVSARELQIKIAQGAKPGEGGQLPALKVWPEIARTRHSTPGVGLISPPPHHDIYSIEDLAQLIYDLRAVNPDAAISVKLVSGTGVGTVAAGVAKGGADVILVSGYDGGTGASPRTAIQHAGLPFELGLAETHQTLVQNGLRSWVRLETDGKLMTGRDIAMAALLGAEEFGFATLPLVAMGCVMMRVCNLDTCPVGVATQDPRLRARFKGRPEHVETLFRFLARDLRETMARMGFRTVDEMVGRTDRLARREVPGRPALADLGPLLHYMPWTRTMRRKNRQGDEWQLFLDTVEQMLEQGPVRLRRTISNTSRTQGTRVGYFLRKRHLDLPDDSLDFRFEGSAGQSFGAFLPAGMTLRLSGEANDYVGKGLSGGRLLVRPPGDAAWEAAHNLLVGNVALYGATSGELLLAGRAGERFAVRNSGATAVCEGTGDHGCEYMTGGVVVVLGPVGRNFAAGMSGGVAYLLDGETQQNRVNPESVDLEPLDGEDRRLVSDLLARHVRETGSPLAAGLLADPDGTLSRFRKVMPHDFRAMREAAARAAAEGLGGDAMMERAFLLRTERRGA